MKFIRFFILTILFAFEACAGENPSVDVTWVGLYSVTSSSKVSERNSLSGEVSQSRGFQHVSTTARIPAVKGTRFGFGFVLSDTDPQAFKVRYVWRFPDGGLINTSTGQASDHFEIERSCKVGDSCANAWVFNHDWELKPGTWSAEVWLGQKMIVSRKFEVYLP